MKTIKILGTGCPNCIKLENNVKHALEKTKVMAIVEKITDPETIMFYDVFSLPGIVINEKLVSSGKVLEIEEIIELLNNSCSKGEDCCGGVNCDDEEDECCDDNSCMVGEEKKSKGGCCCGGNC